MLDAGLINEVSLLICPQAINNSSAPALFEKEGEGPLLIKKFKLFSVEQMEGDTVWLRYKMH